MKNVLIVEDDAVLLRLASDVLTDEGFTITMAGTAADASTALRDRRPDPVVMDLSLDPRTWRGTRLSADSPGRPVPRALGCRGHRVGFRQQAGEMTLSNQTHPGGSGSSSLDSIPPEFAAPFLAALVHDFPLGVVLFDASGYFLFVNQAAAQLNGVPAEAHVGRHIREVVPDLWDDAEPMLRRVLQGEVVEWEISGETPAAPGVTRHWSEQWFPLMGPDDEVAAVAGTILEITDQVEAQAALAQTAEMRDRLIHLTSHELRGPLTNILGYAQRSLRHESVEPIRDYLNVIYDQAIQMRERLELFVALSDMEDLEDAPVDTQTVDLGELVERELTMLGQTHPNMSTDLVRDGEAVVQSDPQLLREVLSGLLDNAAKYSGPAGSVRVRVASTLSGGVIEVHDDGPGISPGQQRRLFEPGFRTKEALASGVDGDGLGLYLADRLTKRLGGSLSVVSDLGAGASFFLHLPEQLRDVNRDG